MLGAGGRPKFQPVSKFFVTKLFFVQNTQFGAKNPKFGEIRAQ